MCDLIQPQYYPCKDKGITYNSLLLFNKDEAEKMPKGIEITNIHYTDLDPDTHRAELHFQVRESGQLGVVPITARQWFQLKHIKTPEKDWIGVIVT